MSDSIELKKELIGGTITGYFYKPNEGYMVQKSGKFFRIIIDYGVVEEAKNV